jgi:hypothetical protein
MNADERVRTPMKGLTMRTHKLVMAGVKRKIDAPAPRLRDVSSRPLTTGLPISLKLLLIIFDTNEARFPGSFIRKGAV